MNWKAALHNLYRPTQPVAESAPAHDAAFLWGPEGLQRLHAWQRLHPSVARRLYVGANSTSLVHTGEDENLGVFGPPRALAGKTAHFLIANLIKHPYMAVVVTTKQGVIPASALVRCSIAGGPSGVYHTSYDGDTYPGLRPGRWSLIAAARGDGDVITECLRQMAGASHGQGQDQKTAFFAENALNYRRAIWTALSLMDARGETWRGRRATERVAREITIRADFVSDMPRLSEVLSQGGYNHLAEFLIRLAAMPPETREGIVGQAVAQDRPISNEAVLRTTDDPNQDLDALILGEPEAHNPDLQLSTEQMAELPGWAYGRYPTLYETADNQDDAAPWLVLKLSYLRRRVVKLNADHERRYGIGIPPVLMASDEQGTIAPIPSFLEDAAKGGVGIKYLSCFQSLHQPLDIWGQDAGRAVFEVLQNLALLPGLRSADILKSFSELNGSTFTEKYTASQSFSSGKDGHNTQGSGSDWVQMDRVPVEAIANGHPHYPGAFSYFPANTSQHFWIHSTPFFKEDTPPWFQILLNEAARITALGEKAGERFFLPLPQMTHNGHLHPATSAVWSDHYSSLHRQWAHFRANLSSAFEEAA